MPILHLENRTPYDVDDLARFFARGLRAFRCRGPKTVKVLMTRDKAALSSRDPATRSRGIAYVGSCSSTSSPNEACEAKSIVLLVAPPAKMTLRRLARLFEHEVLHTLGKEHEQMTEKEYWSEGGVPSWARGCRIRYEGKRGLA